MVEKYACPKKKPEGVTAPQLGQSGLWSEWPASQQPVRPSLQKPTRLPSPPPGPGRSKGGEPSLPRLPTRGCGGARVPGLRSLIAPPLSLQAPPADETQSLTKGAVIDEEEMEIEMQSQRGKPGYGSAPR